MANDESNTARLSQLVIDSHPRVRRIACESLLRLGVAPDAAPLLSILDSEDPVESASARRLIGRIDNHLLDYTHNQ